MYLLLYFCIVILIPHISGKTLPTPLETTNINLKNSSIESPLNETSKVTLSTEGGSIVPQLPLITVPKGSHSDLLTNLDKEIDNSKPKSVVPRKGVRYDSVEDNLITSNRTKERIDSTVSDIKVLNYDKPIGDSVQQPVTKSSTKSSMSTVEELKTKISSTTQSTPPAVPKKPLVLSSEAISETDRKVQMEKAKTESSSKSIVSDQIISPSVKYDPATHSSHPDLVMPIVITMLVVPMFAVLGYMALRRGQEAWKNRHYKRMDFLLDGMYND